jgi:phosphate transport system substrate-binding protein
LAYETGNGDKTSAIKDVLNYMLSDGSQDKAPSLGFVPLKGDILKASKAAVNKIKK